MSFIFALQTLSEQQWKLVVFFSFSPDLQEFAQRNIILSLVFSIYVTNNQKNAQEHIKKQILSEWVFKSYRYVLDFGPLF